MLSEVKRAGIPVGVAILPIVPYINDTDHALRALLRACAQAEVDFVVWDYLHIPNERHRSRINEILARVGNYPASYYRDIYRDQSSVSAHYRRDRDAIMLDRCDGVGLEARAPHRLYAGRLHPSNEAALLLKHAAFRDRVQGAPTWRRSIASWRRRPTLARPRSQSYSRAAPGRSCARLWSTRRVVVHRFLRVCGNGGVRLCL
ncbi:hypothetical protein HC891_08705 [Candidatus Gracilibacteria bacterium]|nr:hypothetical protein [Candidatus Gracilibacteria bacterium]